MTVNVAAIAAEHAPHPRCVVCVGPQAFNVKHKAHEFLIVVGDLAPAD